MIRSGEIIGFCFFGNEKMKNENHQIQEKHQTVQLFFFCLSEKRNSKQLCLRQQSQQNFLDFWKKH